MRLREANKGTRRLLGVALIAALLLALGGLAACGDDDDQEPAEPVQTAEQPSDQGGQGGGGQQGEQTTTTQGGDDDEGEQLFAQHCETCHGPEGEGGAGPSLRNPQLKDAQRVRDQIVKGGGGMPPFGDQLSDAEIDDLTTYVTQELANED